MPFFAGIKNVVSAITINEKKGTTLQVRSEKIICRRKRVSSFAFRFVSASLTVEASFCLTCMVFAMVILILPMRIMNTRRQLQAEIEAINEELCRYAYITYRLEQGDEEQAVPDDYAAVGLGIEWYAGSRISEKVDTKRIRNASMQRSSILTDGETIDLIFDYELELPFPVFSLDAIPQSVRSCRRAWIGTPGGEKEGMGTDPEEDRVVYLGMSATRYHYSRDCHYLSNQLQAVGSDQVEDLRNQSGGKYYPCAVCGAGARSVVYITPNGSRYHTQMQCSAIIAYIRTAKLSEVAHLGGCSYCVK